MACTQSVFSAGVDKTISRVCILRRYLVHGIILHFSECWCVLLIRISLKTAQLATTLGSLCKDRFGVHDHPSLGALRVVCRVSRAHVPCVMRCFLQTKNRPPVQIAWVQRFGFEDASSRAQASVPFFFRSPFFSFFPLVFNCIFFAQILYSRFY